MVMVHGLVTHHTTQARLRAIRGGGSGLPADVEQPGPTVRVDAAPWSERDGVARALVCGVLDAQNRLSITKLSPVLGWAEDAPVVFRITPHRVVVWAGTPTTPLEIASRYVGGRLTLPGTARARLDVGAGDAVLAVTAGDGRLVLAAGADVAQVITGASEVIPAPLEAVAPVKRTGVKSAWRAPVAVGG